MNVRQNSIVGAKSIAGWKQFEILKALQEDHPTVPQEHLDSLIIGGRFKIDQFLGGGGDGNVFKAVDELSQQCIALKLLKEKSNGYPLVDCSLVKQSIVKDLRWLQGFEKSNIIKMYSNFVYLDHIFITFELLGPSLHQIVWTCPEGLPVSRAKAITYNIAVGIEFLHRNKIIHTDIKPGNILFYEPVYDSVVISEKEIAIPFTNDIRIIDLEQFTLVTEKDQKFNHKVTTAEYRAPETLLRCPWSYEVDMWSLGCTALEILTRRSIFHCNRNFEQHLCLIEWTLQTTLPEELTLISPLKSKYFDDLGLYNHNMEDDFPSVLDQYPTLVKYEKVARDKASKVVNSAGKSEESEVQRFFHLLYGLLAIDPATRMTASEYIGCRWFEEFRN